MLTTESATSTTQKKLPQGAMSVGAVLAARGGGGGSVSVQSGMFGYRSTRYTYGYERHEASVKELQRKARLHFTIKDYDTSGKGRLERAQLVQLLTDTDSSTPPGTPPAEEQVEFLLKLCDVQEGGSIGTKELEELLSCWQTFTEKRHFFDSKLEKYDVSKTGKLSKEELKAYLTDLNGGYDVQQADVDWVMKASDIIRDGGLNKMELELATSLWYGYVDRKPQSQCCTTF